MLGEKFFQRPLGFYVTEMDNSMSHHELGELVWRFVCVWQQTGAGRAITGS
jgi:hypothetical protein